MAQLDLIATSAVGLEAVVARELKALGYESKTLQTGRILFRGDEAALCRANLWLRAADRVLVRLGAFEAKDFGQLFDQTYALPWEEWLGADAAFPVNGRSIKSQLSSVPACQKIVKKAIVEKLKAKYGGAWLAETGAQYTVEVALLDDIATLTLDTSGAGLHKRGYRTLVGDAQLKETMAAALVMLSFWRPERQLIDPFCGSGTIPIEAALIGRNIAPGLKRSFAAEKWPAIGAEHWQRARQEARDAMLPDLPLRIIGTDISEDALSLARYHAEQAGVAEQIHFQQRDFHDLTSKKEYGCVICNPPYGERLGDHADLEDLYRAMPTVLRRLKTWSHYILTAYPDFETLVGRKADRRRKLYNARIECTYYQFYGPKPGTYLAPDAVQPRDEEERGTRNAECGAEEILASGGRQPPGRLEAHGMPDADERGTQSAERGAETVKQMPRVAVARPAFGGLSAKSREQGELFARRLTARARHLRPWPKRGITCYRLYDRDIPEIPLAVDRYEDCLHLAEYERPHDRTPGEHADWLDLMARTAAKTLEVSPANVFMKRRERQRGTAQYERFAEAGHALEVNEGGLKFRVNLSDYLDTGLFLDHRITRSMVRDQAAGKRFLNLFGYTGSFTVYAAAGGATTTTTVDLS
ncbi:MAG TPA: bifunctional 23S rRNA (guanine(2069)-N(7))-methyltransferase RlmK/23S rRNA (guanine(2445)-N(2))-methyltransferase RlmL, partial [Pirellulales bacterium]|nr:bifunctional 23S rRNA (guanine(2069)-N(7))-methyltransferase RlmK/23S rRNA (guanine(2445)-N(2))-methyltransferase RlmL [Pirellulales bacterium]